MGDIEKNIRSVLRNKYFRKGLRFIKKAESITRPVVDAFKNPSIPAFTHASMAMIGELDSAYNIHTSDEFWDEEYDGRAWVPFPYENLHAHVIGMIRQHVVESIDVSTWTKVIIADVDGIVFAWATCMLSSGLTTEDELHVLSRESLPRAREMIKKKAWDRSDKHVQVTFSSMHKFLERRNLIQIKSDDVHNIYRTERAKEWCARIGRFLAKDQNRSYMFYGPPGTGKSSLIRSLTEMLDLTSVRVNIEHLQSQNGSIVSDVIEVFCPDAIIIDDVDRSSESLMTQLLDILEQYKKSIKVIFMSANWIENFDCATIRPGRIDELVPITQLDDLAVKTILGEQHQELFDQVHKWPVAYIVEATKRREVDTPERFEESMRELRLRCEHDSLAFNNADPIGLSVTKEQEQEMQKAREEKLAKKEEDNSPIKRQAQGKKKKIKSRSWMRLKSKTNSSSNVLLAEAQVTGSLTPPALQNTDAVTTEFVKWLDSVGSADDV